MTTKSTITSFDLDGTLVDYSFVNAVWLEGIPQLYADEKGISREVAKTKVKKEYDKVGMNRLEWYNIQFWLKRFGLNSRSRKFLFKKYKHKINTYPAVLEVLCTLKDQGHTLLVISNAARDFLDTELKETNLKQYFYRVFSATSDFRQVKKTETLYQKILNILHIEPSEMTHVGDNWHFDYLAPRKAGIQCYFLDRENQTSGLHVVKDLTEFMSKIS